MNNILQKQICKVCDRELNSYQSLSNHIGKKHQDLGVEGYYLEYIDSSQSSSCLNCDKKMNFNGLRYGYGKTNYCGECFLTYCIKTKKKISDTVTQHWTTGIYSKEALSIRVKKYYNSLSLQQKEQYLKGFMNSSNNIFNTGRYQGYFYRSSLEKKFLETYVNSKNYKIVKCNHSIKYFFDKKERLFFLDFVLKSKFGNIIFVEVKGNHMEYQEEIRTNKAYFKYGAAKRICDENGFDFWFLSYSSKRLTHDYISKGVHNG